MTICKFPSSSESGLSSGRKKGIFPLKKNEISIKSKNQLTNIKTHKKGIWPPEEINKEMSSAHSSGLDTVERLALMERGK